MTHFNDSTSTSHKITSELQGVSSTFSSLQSGVILPAQLRAARGLLDWTRNECGQAANVSPETIKNIEHGAYTPQQATSDNILQALAAHGVECISFMNFRLLTLSGNELGRIVNVSGAVLVTPVKGDGLS